LGGEHHKAKAAGRLRENWIDIIRRDLKEIGVSWEEAQECCAERKDWYQRVAECVFDVG